MRRVGLLWQFFPPLLTILVVSIVLVTGFSGRAIRSFMVEHTTDNLESFAKALSPEFAQQIPTENYPEIQDICVRLGRDSGYRLTVVLADGLVVGDSDEDPALMGNHADRPEIMAALEGHLGSSQRYSSTLGHQRLYVAVPGDSTFVVRTSLSLDDLGSIMTRLYGEIALVSFALLILAGLMGFILARKVSNSLKHLQNGAEAFAAGNLGGRIRVDDSLEINAVATSMNNMADQLAERIRTAESQRNELEAVLASMNEGVLAVDPNQNIIRLNRMAAELLEQDCAHALGRSIQEIGRHPELTRLTEDILSGTKIAEKDIRIGGPNGRLLRVQASSLVDRDDLSFGVLLVMSDMTELRRLETMRRDFVANVSHELKTPITSIKGFVETLIETPPEDPKEAGHFLAIINRQTDRLENIISDLLALSRLEEGKGTDNLEMVEVSLNQFLDRFVRELASRNPKAAERVQISCPDDLRPRINPPLLEQAIGNLIDNALKYSPENSSVQVTCFGGPEGISLAITDRGSGIPAQHLPRIFERFYRVDKARSRRMGGTGLGLAIVKHITQIHGGQATVTSNPGQGSTFTLTLPAEGPQ
jgi:two-component system, OmpR family, phosphate regulon sensor histidine kinase PhoR